MRKKLPNLDIDDGEDADMTALRERALAVEDAARSVFGVTNSEGGGAGHGRAQVALVTSHCFAGAYGGSRHSLWASVCAGGGATMAR